MRVTEGGQAAFTVRLDAVSGKDVTVRWGTSDGEAEAGSDYTGHSNQLLTIPAGQRSKTLTVPTTDDTDDEPDETFMVTLSNPTNATLSDDTGEAVIEDNDEPPPPVDPTIPPTVTVSDATAVEGEPLKFAVTLSHAYVGEVVVRWTIVGNGATPDVDYKSLSYQHELVFAPGETLRYINDDARNEDGEQVYVETYADALEEPDEAVLLIIVRVEGGELGERDYAEGTIRDKAPVPDGPDGTALQANAPVEEPLSAPPPAFPPGDGGSGDHSADWHDFNIGDVIGNYYDLL